MYYINKLEQGEGREERVGLVKYLREKLASNSTWRRFRMIFYILSSPLTFCDQFHLSQVIHVINSQ